MKYQLSAVNDQIIRVRIGSKELPEDASWAVLDDSRKPLGCEAPKSGNADTAQNMLKTSALTASVASQSGQINITDQSGNTLWSDKSTPVFNADGSFSFSGTIPEGSVFYGLGDKYPNATTNGVVPVNRAGRTFITWTAEPGQNGNYRALPFYIRRTGDVYTGYLLDNTWKQSYDFGKTEKGTISTGAEGGGIDFYVISGKSPKEVLSNYARLTGTTPLQPLWAYGWQQSKWAYESAQWINDNIISGTQNAGYRNLNIPADAIWLDIQYQYANRPFTVDTSSKYSGLDKYIKRWAEQDFKTVVITDAHVSATTEATGAAATPNTPAATQSGQSIYSEAAGQGYFLTNADGKTEYKAQVWPYNSSAPTLSVFPDFTYKPARDWWGMLSKPFYTTFGVAGFWNDMNEPVAFNGDNNIVPRDKLGRIEEKGFTSRPVTQKEAHNLFGMQNTRASYDGLLAIKPDQRPFVMTRASYAGGQRYAVTWTGDNHSTWADLRIATNNITDLGLAGFVSGADIGGYGGQSAESPDLHTRWTQIGSFYPISRNHSEKGSKMQEPWVNVTEANRGGPLDDLAIRTKYIRNRYALMPYIYTVAEEGSRTGIPMMRRMFLEYPDANAPGDAGNIPLDVAAETQFMMGPDLLIAPSPIEQEFKSAPPPSVPFGKAVEAENTMLSGGASTNNNHTGASGGRFVDKLENTGAGMSISLTDVPADGSFAFQVRYSNGGAVNNLPATRTLSLIVNGGNAGKVSFPALASWNSWSTAKVNIPLKAGTNSIRLAYDTGDTGFVNVDQFAVTQGNETYPVTVAAVSSNKTTAAFDVLMPPGKWYDYWTGKIVQAPSNSTETSWTYNISKPSLAELPVFVRGGSIIPKVPDADLPSIRSTVDVARIETIDLVVYPGDNCKGSLYVDDGTSFNYRKGGYYRRNFTCEVSGNQVRVDLAAAEGEFIPSWKRINVRMAGSSASQLVDETRVSASVTLPLPNNP